MDLRRLIIIIRKWLPLGIACVLLAAVTSIVVTGFLPNVYEAKATLIVGQSLSAVNPDYNQLLVSQRLSTTYASLAKKRPILESVVSNLRLKGTADDLAKLVRADAPLDSTLLTITAQNVDPQLSAAIANELAAQLIAASPAIQGRQAEFQASIDADLQATQAQIDSTQTQVDDLSAVANPTTSQAAQLSGLEGRLVSLRATYAALLSFSSSNAANLLTVVEPAIPPDSPVSPRPLLNLLLAVALGVLIAGGIAFGVELLDDSIKNAEAIQEVTGLSLLGGIPSMKGGRDRSEIYRLATLLYPRSFVSEAYRTLRSNIEFASVDVPISTLLVTSSIPGEGKTVTASNLAVVFAQAGRRVLLVDADLRKPGLHVVFDLPNDAGLTSLLRDSTASIDATAQATEEPNLRVLTTGPIPPNPAELMASKRMRSVLGTLNASVDLVIFDSPPLEAVTDSAILSSFLDGTIYVVDVGRSHRPQVRAGREALSKAGAKVLGAVLNRTPARIHSDYYGAYYGTDEAVGRAATLAGGASERAGPSSHVPRTS